jgi:Ser/Thr protein kinase RdoA (MazF antagonist)
MTDEEVHNWVRIVAEDAGLGAVSQMERLEGGIVNEVYRVNQDWIVRIGTGSDGVQFPKSADVLRAVAGRIKAPALLYTDFSLSKVPYNVQVLSFISGSPLSRVWADCNQEQKRRWVLSILEEMSRLYTVNTHEIPCFADFEPWADREMKFLITHLEEAKNRNAYPTERLDRMEKAIETHADSLHLAPPAVLIHCDTHWGNVIVRDGEIAGLIDFDDTDIAPPEMDLWNLAFALSEEETGLEMAQVLKWIVEARPELFRSKGIRGRFILEVITDILDSVGEATSWRTRSEGLRDADEMYSDLFETNRYEELMTVLGEPPLGLA